MPAPLTDATRIKQAVDDLVSALADYERKKRGGCREDTEVIHYATARLEQQLETLHEWATEIQETQGGNHDR